MSLGQDRIEERIGGKYPRGCDVQNSAGTQKATMPDVAISSAKFKDYEVKSLLTQAKNEIQGLRRHNEILSAQMGIVDVFAAALGLKRETGAMHPDVAWELQIKIDELSKAEASRF